MPPPGAVVVVSPETITVRALSDTRFKVHVEPEVLNRVACVDLTGEFTLQP